MMQLAYDSLFLNDALPDDNGALWYATEFQGWSGPDTRMSTADPTSKHGSILTRAMLGTRAITVSGICKAPDEASYWASYNRLLEITANLHTPKMFVVYETVPKFVMCIRGDAPDIKIGFGSSFRFTFDLLALDPLKYTLDEVSLTVGAGSTATVTNQGTFATTPRIITGGNVSLSNATHGGTVATALSVPSGTVFDFTKRTVMSGSTSKYGNLAPNTEWWSLDVGANIIRNQGGSSATVFYRHAFV